MRDSLEEIIEGQAPSALGKVAAVDIAGTISYSLVVGSLLDYASGLGFAGIVASRSIATVFNTITGGPYGWWREKVHSWTKTREESPRVRKTLIDLLAFNTFQAPFYSLIVGLSSYLTEGKADTEKMVHAASYISGISPFIGPTMGWYLDRLRKVFGIASAAKGAYKQHVRDDIYPT
ncbi:L-alanine exporter AlaE [Candidatus Woesearchaeota archaeon]|nr:MAG: hypothetical protein QS99_C0001G0017 [archaeon GW2011_AR4]MBS3129228.1 L-alanine exporter AlaE [Candidatus Woesearchaeota archaeon]HIH38531.1 L-alanine exporter AlaE [Candidatus Woesearchaeota archaeon]HIH48486.1 L-alanine exporter AlaE [Candidatus Woesearchaeota archaeon]HIJ02735.1 L-alanine exporter AlaE [Candidatus Woesearchaeota archaeon]